jgi:hypothetical protein
VNWKLLEVVSREEQVAANDQKYLVSGYQISRGSFQSMGFTYAPGGYIPSFAHPNSPTGYPGSIKGLSANYVIYDEVPDTRGFRRKIQDQIKWTTDYIAKTYGKHQ